MWTRFKQWLEGEDEIVVTFPTYAVRAADGSARVVLRAWVYEPERESWWRSRFVEEMQSRLTLEAGTPEAELFNRRVRPFLVDNERRQKVYVEVGGEVHEMGISAADGHVEATMSFAPAAVSTGTAETPAGRHLRVRAFIESDSDEQLVPLIESAGRSVISDIDDTVKITNVLDRVDMLRNTFLRPFKPVHSLAERYDEWRDAGAQFHYVTSSPWQLLPFLEEFLEEHRFPGGSFHMRKLRPKSVRSPVDFVTSSQEHKLETIRELLSDFPNRSFTMVGDSGEKDPEVYGEMAREFGAQVERILIREVPSAQNTSDRFEAAFADVDADWSVEPLD